MEPRLQRISQGDRESLALLFQEYRPRLRQMIALRLDRRLRGRVDPSDVLQELYVDVSRKAAEYASRSDMPFYLWLRLTASQKLCEIHRRHLVTQRRSVRRETGDAEWGREVSSEQLAHQLLGRHSTPSHAAIREENRVILERILAQMEPIDREVLALRHFEELTNDEVAKLLGISKAAASNRYIRALKRLRKELNDFPSLFS